MMIRPASKNQLKNWKKLLMSKYRKKEKQFLAEGFRCVMQIIENGVVPVGELIIEEGFETETFQRVDLPVYSVSGEEFATLADTESPQGVIAVCNEPESPGPEKMAAGKGLIVVFDAIQDPGNLGTMIRTAAWFGTGGFICGAGTADIYHPKVVRSTAGATGVIPYLKGDLQKLCGEFEQNGWQIILLDGSDRSVDIRAVKPGRKTLLVVGNEARGISPELFEKNRISVRIPGNNGTVESLNAAVALGIGLYHFYG